MMQMMQQWMASGMVNGQQMPMAQGMQAPATQTGMQAGVNTMGGVMPLGLGAEQPALMGQGLAQGMAGQMLMQQQPSAMMQAPVVPPVGPFYAPSAVNPFASRSDVASQFFAQQRQQHSGLATATPQRSAIPDMSQVLASQDSSQLTSAFMQLAKAAMNRASQSGDQQAHLIANLASALSSVTSTPHMAPAAAEVRDMPAAKMARVEQTIPHILHVSTPGSPSSDHTRSTFVAAYDERDDLSDKDRDDILSDMSNNDRDDLLSQLSDVVFDALCPEQ